MNPNNIWDFDKPITIGFYPDAHTYPGHDQQPVEAMGAWFGSEGVDVVVNIGDFADMGSLSSYDKATLSIEGKRVQADLDYTREMNDLFIHSLGGHEAHLIMTEGNHEERLWRAEKADPQLQGIFGEDPWGYAEAGYYVYDYLDVVRINGLAFSHAFVNPYSLMGGIQGGSADIRMKNVGFPHVAGHQHGPLIHGQRRRGDGTALSTLIIGCAHTESHGYWGKGRDVFRGGAILRNVENGAYDLEVKSLDNIMKEYL